MSRNARVSGGARAGLVLLLLAGAAWTGCAREKPKDLPNFEVVYRDGYLTTIAVAASTTEHQLEVLVRFLRQLRREDRLDAVGIRSRNRYKTGQINVFRSWEWADMKTLRTKPIPFAVLNKHIVAHYKWDQVIHVDMGFIGYQWEQGRRIF
ncbi:MAG: hypothetical protein HYY85_03225 [Deltaproteobacteria bacterium]|nr:hypothetical protein [Deltaproteobacteria bacterium]